MENHDDIFDDESGSEEKKHENGYGSCLANTRDLAGHAGDFFAELTNDSKRSSSENIQQGDPSETLRMEAAWAQAQAEYSKRMNRSQPQSPYNGDNNVSPLMATFSDPNSLNKLSSRLTDESPACNSLNVQGQQRTKICQMQQPATKPSAIQRYRIFLQKHEPSLDILERIMERFVFYRYLFKHDHGGMHIELYYAAWNIIRWMNDVVLVGWGTGMGVTVGRREEWLGDSTTDSNTKSIQDRIFAKMHTVVPVLRGILAATTCVYPALEAWSRRPISCRPNIQGTEMNDSLNREEWRYATTTDSSPRSRRMQWESRQSRAADLSYRVERIRFVARLALLSISWWARYRRKCLHDKENGTTNNSVTSLVPSLLRQGGELDPCEELLPLDMADVHAATKQYVGKRTGRRSVPTAPATISSYTKASQGNLFVKYLSELISSKHNILYFHVVGELLHILRPMYWARSESIDWKYRTSTARHGSTFSASIWKAWLLSLLMDLISDELLDVTTGCQTHQAPKRNKSPFMSRSTTTSSDAQSVQQSEQEELEWRRSRRSLYLLRSPVYSAITLPVVTCLTKILTTIPSFGFGRWASEYILDMLSYWNEHRFMLE